MPQPLLTPRLCSQLNAALVPLVWSPTCKGGRRPQAQHRRPHQRVPGSSRASHARRATGAASRSKSPTRNTCSEARQGASCLLLLLCVCACPVLGAVVWCAVLRCAFFCKWPGRPVASPAKTIHQFFSCSLAYNVPCTKARRKKTQASLRARPIQDPDPGGGGGCSRRLMRKGALAFPSPGGPCGGTDGADGLGVLVAAPAGR